MPELEEYVGRFVERFPAVEVPPPFESYATPERYDELYMGAGLREAMKGVTNDRGGIAWGFASRIRSLNQLYDATGQHKYLDASRESIRRVQAVRDDRRGISLWNGRVVPAWGSGVYAQRGRAVFAVHTGVIVASILEYLLLRRQDTCAGQEEEGVMLRDALEALEVHERQWRQGPRDSEGHYVGLDQEDGLDGRPLPGNRLSAMGLAHWLAWKLTREEKHRERALALGLYIKNRLAIARGDAYVWPYWLPELPDEVDPKCRPEDTSHAGLTISLPLALAEDGEVFDTIDLRRLSRTVTLGFGRFGEGVLGSQIWGIPDIDPSYVGAPVKWLPLSQADGEVFETIAEFYLLRRPVPNPIEISMLLRFRR